MILMYTQGYFYFDVCSFSLFRSLSLSLSLSFALSLFRSLSLSLSLSVCVCVCVCVLCVCVLACIALLARKHEAEKGIVALHVNILLKEITVSLGTISKAIASLYISGEVAVFVFLLLLLMMWSYFFQ